MNFGDDFAKVRGAVVTARPSTMDGVESEVFFGEETAMFTSCGSIGDSITWAFYGVRCY